MFYSVLDLEVGTACLPPHTHSRPLYNRNMHTGACWAICIAICGLSEDLSISFSPVDQNNCWGSGPSGWASVCFGQRIALRHGCRQSTKKTGKNDGDPALGRLSVHIVCKISMACISLMLVEMWSCPLIFIRACTISSLLKCFVRKLALLLRSSRAETLWWGLRH